MRNDIKQAANMFLLKTYNFDEETRTRLIEKAALEIIQNCQQLLLSFTSKEHMTPAKYAHRLKSNLKALGLIALADEAKIIEDHKSLSKETSLRTAMDLCRKITAKL